MRLGRRELGPCRRDGGSRPYRSRVARGLIGVLYASVVSSSGTTLTWSSQQTSRQSRLDSSQIKAV